MCKLCTRTGRAGSGSAPCAASCVSRTGASCPRPLAPDGAEPWVYTFHEDQSGNLWIGTDDGLKRWRNGVLTSYSTAEGLPDNEVRALLEDREGSLWFGTRHGGLEKRGRGGDVRFISPCRPAQISARPSVRRPPIPRQGEAESRPMPVPSEPASRRWKSPNTVGVVAVGPLTRPPICMYRVCMSVVWDPNKAAANLEKHGVRFADAELVLFDSQAITLEDPAAEGEQRQVSLGRDGLDRVLVVVYTYRDEDTRLISARRATRRERRQYEEGIRFQLR